MRNLAIFWMGIMEEEGKELLFYVLICELKCERERLMECRFFCWFGWEGDGERSLPLPYPCLSRAVDYF